MAVSTVKTSLADIMTQMAVEGKTVEQIDWKRNVSQLIATRPFFVSWTAAIIWRF